MTNPDDLTDDERAEYEQAWDDLDEKVIIAQILTELQQIRMLLSDAESGASDNSTDSVTYDCRKCSATVPAAERERHARAEHKAPADMIGLMFTRVE